MSRLRVKTLSNSLTKLNYPPVWPPETTITGENATFGGGTDQFCGGQWRNWGNTGNRKYHVRHSGFCKYFTLLSWALKFMSVTNDNKSKLVFWKIYMILKAEDIRVISNNLMTLNYVLSAKSSIDLIHK